MRALKRGILWGTDKLYFAPLPTYFGASINSLASQSTFAEGGRVGEGGANRGLQIIPSPFAHSFKNAIEARLSTLFTDLASPVTPFQSPLEHSFGAPLNTLRPTAPLEHSFGVPLSTRFEPP